MISIIIITKDRKDELERAIRSCFSQTYKEFEIIIIDNGSKERLDKEIEILFRESNIEYRYEYKYENLGVAGGRNYGFSISKGDICFFLDDDAIVTDENVFMRAIEDFTNDDSIAALACNIYQPLDNTYLFSHFLKNTKNYVMTYVGAAHFIRKDLWGNKKLYPQSFLYGSEEMYSALYIYKMGRKIGYDERLAVNHLPSQINRKVGNDRKTDIIINTYIARRHFYPNQKRIILWMFLQYHLIKNGLFNIFEIRNRYLKRYDKGNDDQMSNRQYKAYSKILPLSLRY